ncbi:MAG: sugar ABC transporter permease [Clostridiales bacterium]|nr:sugar ABC transporter permease [Clostridiales bacterium]
MKLGTKFRYLGKDIRKNKDNYFMILPYFIFFLVFTIIPVLVAIYLSFTYFNLLQPPQFRGLFNYIRLFLDDDVFLIALKNTLIFALLTGPASYLICVLFAWLINELPSKLRAFMTLVFYAPSISGTLYVIWGFIFSGDSYGMVNGFLMQIGLINDPILWLTDPKYNMTILIIIQIWLSLGTSFLALIAGLQGVDRSLYEAGAIDGIRNRFQELIKITIPSIGPSLMFSAVMQIASSFAVGRLSMALAGFPSTDNSASTIVTHLLDYGNYRYEMGYACAIATVLFIMMLTMNAFVKFLLRKYND